MRYRAFVYAILAFIVSSCLAAEDYTITRTMFIPAVYHVGDTVEMRLSLRTAFATKLVVPKEITQPGWGTISGLRLVEREDEPELRLFFTSYSAGTRTLPSINLGPIVLEGINIYVTSMLSDDQESTSPSGSREQVLIPFSIVKLILQIILIMLVPTALFFIGVATQKFLRRYLWGRRDRLPWRRIQHSLHAMEKTLESFDARSFYIRLLEETRVYLSDRLRISAFSATSAELEKNLLEHVHHQESVRTLMVLFRHGDRVKFAGEPATIQSRMKDIQTLEKVLLHIEHEEHFRRMAENRGENAHVDA